MPCRNCSCPNCIDEFDEYSKYTWISTREEAEDFLTNDKDASHIRKLTFAKACDIDDDFIKRLTNRHGIGYVETLDLDDNKKVTNQSIKYLLDSNNVCGVGSMKLHGGLGVPYKDLTVLIKGTGVDTDYFYDSNGCLDNYPSRSILFNQRGKLYRTHFTIVEKGKKYTRCCKFIVLMREKNLYGIPDKL